MPCHGPQSRSGEGEWRYLALLHQSLDQSCHQHVVQVAEALKGRRGEVGGEGEAESQGEGEGQGQGQGEGCGKAGGCGEDGGCGEGAGRVQSR